MSYPKKTLELRPTKGLILDIPPHEVGPDYYTNGRNVIFRNGFAQRIRGHRDAYSTAIKDIAVPGGGGSPYGSPQVGSPTPNIPNIYHTINAESGGTNYWLIFDANGDAHSLETSNSLIITGGSPDVTLTATTQPNKFSSALLNGVPIISNSADEPMYWDGTLLRTLPDWTATESAKSIAVFQYHIFAMDIDGPGGAFPNLIKWSDAAEPGTVPDSWNAAAANEAGDLELSYGAGPLLCAVPLRDQLIVYKRTARFAARYVGGQNIFEFRTVSSNAGAINRHAVADLGDGRHLVVEQADIVLFDGINSTSVGELRMKKFLFDDLDQDNYENLHVTFNRAEKEVVIAYPSTGSVLCDKALVYDVVNDSFGFRELPNVASTAVGIVNDDQPSDIIDDNLNIIDDYDVLINQTTQTATESLIHIHGHTLEQQDTTDLTMVQASVGKYDIDFDSPERVKFIKKVHVKMKSGFGAVQFRVGARMTPTDAITWSPAVTLTEPEQIVNTFAQGRYISYELSSMDTNVWTMTGANMEAEVRGYF